MDATDTYDTPCLACGATVRVAAGNPQAHACEPPGDTPGLVARAYWAGYDRARGGTSGA